VDDNPNTPVLNSSIAGDSVASSRMRDATMLETPIGNRWRSILAICPHIELFAEAFALGNPEGSPEGAEADLCIL
jgi:hypothetical protein